MKLKDRFSADKRMFVTLSREEKHHFIWDYYKIPILFAAVLLVLAVLTLAIRGENRDVAVYAVFVNSDLADQSPDPKPLNDLLQRAGLELGSRTVDITANLTLGRTLDESYDSQTVQVLAALFGVSGLDVFAADQAVFERYADQDAFLDLHLFLTPEKLRTPYLCENADGQTIAAGVVLEDSLLHRMGYYHEPIVLGIAARAQNLDEALALVRALLKD